MKATGIIRRVDDLGRIVIPKEVRRRLRIKEGDPLELYLEGENIIFKKYEMLDNVKAVVENAKSYINADDDLPFNVAQALLRKIEEMEDILKKEEAENEDN